MGSISGVSPTAMEMANNAAFIQFPLVNPFRKSTTGTIHNIKRIKIRDTEFTPFSNEVFPLCSVSAPAILPSRVPSPVAATIPLPLPLITLLPIKARFAYSVKARSFRSAPARFSTGSLSPVSADWLINKSLAASNTMSAGSISPAETCTTSPTTSSSMGISSVIGLPFSPIRVTAAVERIISDNFSAALPLFVSCAKRSSPEINTIAAIMPTVTPFFSPCCARIISVYADTPARTRRMAVNGFIKAWKIRCASEFSVPPDTTFRPYFLREFSTLPVSIPSTELSRKEHISSCVWPSPYSSLAADCSLTLLLLSSFSPMIRKKTNFLILLIGLYLHFYNVRMPVAAPNCYWK